MPVQQTFFPQLSNSKYVFFYFKFLLPAGLYRSNGNLRLWVKHRPVKLQRWQDVLLPWWWGETVAATDTVYTRNWTTPLQFAVIWR